MCDEGSAHAEAVTSNNHTQLSHWALLGMWLCLAAGAFGALGWYSMRSGDLSVPVTADQAGLAVHRDVNTLYIAIHPMCPCTRASLYELQSLQGHAPDALDYRFLVYLPESHDQEKWFVHAESVLARYGFEGGAIKDREGHLAYQIGCRTSGSVVLYDPKGTPLFWGGITPSRGHSGPNTGIHAIRTLILDDSFITSSAPVYGCPLENESGALCSDTICGVEP